VQNGDALLVNVWGQASLSQEVTVRPDGNITLPLVGDVSAAGQTPAALGVEIGRRLNGLVLDPKVSVSVRTSREPSISVVGEVKTAGTYPLRPGEGVLEILARAGGLSEFASKDNIFVIRRQAEPLRVRFRYDALAAGDGAGLAFQLQDGDILVVE
jgi:polysaccharide export outer membrane protein